MSRYSSNSDDDSYRSKKSRRKRHRLVNFFLVSHELYQFLMARQQTSAYLFLDPNRTHLTTVIEKDEMTDEIDGHAAEVEIGSYHHISWF